MNTLAVAYAADYQLRGLGEAKEDVGRGCAIPMMSGNFSILLIISLRRQFFMRNF